MPSDLTLKLMNRVHRLALALSGGRLGWRAGGMPVLELTTTGRKSGLARSVMLTSPVQEGTTIVVVASRGGDDQPPAWLLNITTDNRVHVALEGAPRTAMRARVASPQERARLWPKIAAEHQNYAGYQLRTDREIAVVLLDTVGNSD